MYMAKKSTSSIFILLLVLIIIVLCFFLFKKNATTPAPINTSPAVVATTPITITEQDFQEANFTGKHPVITGSGALPDAARSFITQSISSFKESADQDVPAMRAQFGTDTASDDYELDIKATYLKGSTTESIVVDEYVYTGGANGNSVYKVFTDSATTGKLLSLSDVIVPAKQAAFTALVKSKLSTWAPDGSDGPVVFPDAVKELTFASFTDWSLDAKNLTLYFSKYDIGPGALGAVTFPISRTALTGDITAGY